MTGCLLPRESASQLTSLSFSEFGRAWRLRVGVRLSSVLWLSLGAFGARGLSVGKLSIVPLLETHAEIWR